MTPWTPAQLLAYRDRILGINTRHKEWALRRAKQLSHSPQKLTALLTDYEGAMISAHQQLHDFPWELP